MKPILVVGGINMDILAMPQGEFSLGDSMMGKIHLSPGGVGRNMAEHLAKYDFPVELMTVLGNDSFADILKQSCQRLNIGLKHAINSQQNSCVYLAVHNEQGDMAIAVNDMKAMSLLGEDQIKSLESDDFSACMLDANLSQDSLLAIAHHLNLPLIADPVSCVKAGRLMPILKKLFAIKPNLLEALLMTKQNNEFDAASFLLDQGLQQVYISMGKDGLYCADRQERYHFPATAAAKGPTTGAGDAMTAGLVAAIAQGKGLLEIAASGVRFADEHLAHMAALHHTD